MSDYLDEPSLTELQDALEAEQKEWNRAGLSLDNMQLNQAAGLLFDLQIKMQALINVLIINDAISEEALNYQYKRIMLNDMRALRESIPDQEREAIRQRIISGAQIPPNGYQKPPWER